MNDTWVATKVCVVSHITNRFVTGITADHNGNIYFTADDDNIYHVRQDAMNAKPKILVNIRLACLSGIVWIKNILYICNGGSGGKNCKIYQYAIDTRRLTTLVGDRGAHIDGNFKEARFDNPHAITVDKNGDLYIGEWAYIRKINLADQTVITVAGSGVLGHQDGAVQQAQFKNICGLAVHNDGTIYVVELWNQCVRRIKDGIVSTIAGTPEVREHEDGPLNVATFSAPAAVIVDVDGSPLIGEHGIRRVDLKHQVVFTEVPASTVSDVFCFAKSKPFELFAGSYSCVWKLVKTWKWKRWIWIGHLKENPNDCLLATLPREIIKEISLHL